MARCDGSSKLSGTWSARTLPGLKDRSRRETVGIRAREGSQWNTALEKRRVGPSAAAAAGGGEYEETSARENSTPGSAARAVSSMAGDESIPDTTAEGKWVMRDWVLFPGPQPRSTMRDGGVGSDRPR